MSEAFSPALFAHLADRIPKAAKEAARRFTLVDQDDFEQEMWMRALVSADLLHRYLEAEQPEFIWRKLKDYGHRYGMQDDRDRRARKAAAAGYTTYDEVFYTPAMVGHLLAQLIEADWDLVLAMDRATTGSDLNGTRIQQGGDDSHDSYIDFLALLVDVKAAYDRLTRAQQDILVIWYREGTDEDAAKWDRESIAGSMGLAYHALAMRVHRALAALVQQLGGQNPYVAKRRGESEGENA